jgi:hypothetical protein
MSEGFNFSSKSGQKASSASVDEEEEEEAR